MSAPIVLAHGFTQTARSWAEIELLIADRLGTVTVAVDMPGHGSAAEHRCDLWGSADHLVARAGSTPATYVGYSMGGRVGLHAALAHPDLVGRLVLIGATAGIDDAPGRENRRAADGALADRIEAIGVEAFLDEWLANPLFAGLTPATSQRADRLRNTAVGLAASLRLTGTGTQEPLWERLAEITIPVLLLVGEDDTKFRAVATRMQTLLPDATLVVISGAGHSVHLERPVATVEAIATWLGPT